MPISWKGPLVRRFAGDSARRVRDFIFQAGVGNVVYPTSFPGSLCQRQWRSWQRGYTVSSWLSTPVIDCKSKLKMKDNPSFEEEIVLVFYH